MVELRELTYQETVHRLRKLGFRYIAMVKGHTRFGCVIATVE